MISQYVLWHGSEDRPLEPVTLSAGPLKILYEDGDLRYIRLGSREILRRIYVAVRDRNWNTVPAKLEDIDIQHTKDQFEVRFHAIHQQKGIDFRWDGHISGNAQGTIRFSLNGEAYSDFWRNRIGFCVLHPVRECAGKLCIVTHCDGSVERSHFPRYISPHQPFKDIRAIRHQVLPGIWAQVTFEGDVFEMEDQRNWTDASFKIYSTPLDLPFPVLIQRGTRIHQTVTLQLDAERLQLPMISSSPSHVYPTLAISEGTKRLPHIGLGIGAETLGDRELDRIRKLNLSHLRVDLDLSSDSWLSTLERAQQIATQTSTKLEAALKSASTFQSDMPIFRKALKRPHPPICRWLVFVSDNPILRSGWPDPVRTMLAPLTPQAMFALGSDANFTELNRNRPDLADADMLCYSLNPQVHAFDNRSLVETLPIQALTARSARLFAGKKPLVISPITLKQRFNPVATSPELPRDPNALPPYVDVRQMSLFGAGWTAASLKYIGLTGYVHSVTYYTLAGCTGILQPHTRSTLPEAFPPLSGCVYPMYHVFRAVGEMRQGELLETHSSDSLTLEGLGIRMGPHCRVIAANLTFKAQKVRIQGVGKGVSFKLLDQTNALSAMSRPEAFWSNDWQPVSSTNGEIYLELAPYGLAFIDWWETLNRDAPVPPVP